MKVKGNKMDETIIHKYNSTEEKFIRNNFGTFVSECFENHFFSMRGRQTRIISIKELFKYADMMHENRLNRNVQIGLCGHINPQEFDEFKHIILHTYNFYIDICGFKTTGADALSRALAHKRVLIHLVPNAKSVLEIGPGSGFLPLLLPEPEYFAIENTQSFFILQSLLWQSYCDDYYVHWEPPITLANNKKTINHIPWWTICLSDIPSVNAVFMNHLMFELSLWAFKFYVKKISLWLAEDGIVILEGLGASSHRQFEFEYAISTFNKHGLYVRHYGPLVPVSGFTYLILSRQDSGWENKNSSFTKNIMKQIPFNRRAIHIINRISQLKQTTKEEPSFIKIGKSINLNQIKHEIEKYDISNVGIMSNQDFLQYIDEP